MAKSKKIRTTSLDELKSKYIGKEETAKRNQYEIELKLDVIGEMIRTARKERNLTQEELGKLVGVQKAQISKLEKGSTNVTISTILKVFDALKAKVKLNIDLPDVKLA